MQTRSRKISEAVGDAIDVVTKATPVKNIKRTKITSREESATPTKVQKADALVESILNSVQKSKLPTTVPSENANLLKGNDKLVASEKTKMPKVATQQSKIIRGQPKSGRPWKDVKQKYVVTLQIISNTFD